MTGVPHEGSGGTAAGPDSETGDRSLTEPPELAQMGRPAVPEPGKPFLFTPGNGIAAENAIAEIVGERTSYLGPEDNIAVLPVLPSDPAAVIDGRVSPTQDLAPRPSARVIAPRRRETEVTVELMAARRTKTPILKLIAEAAVVVPAGWHPRKRRFASGRRVAWLSIPIEALPADVLRFVCAAVTALSPPTATGHFILVRSRATGIFSLGETR